MYLYICLQNTGAEIGEFLTPLIFLCHSYKKWTLELCNSTYDRGVKNTLCLGRPCNVQDNTTLKDKKHDYLNF